MVAVGGDWRTLGSCGQGSRTEFLKRATSDSWWKAWSRREQAARYSFQQGLACSCYQAFPIMMDGYPWKYEQNKSFLLYVFLVRYLVLLLRNVANTIEFSPTCCAGNVIPKFTWWWYLDVGYFGRKLSPEELYPHGWMKSGINGWWRKWALSDALALPLMFSVLSRWVWEVLHHSEHRASRDSRILKWMQSHSS